jgi:hypothetical protein
MQDSIVRLYGTDQQARDAARDLVEAGFPENEIFVLTPQTEARAPKAPAVGPAPLEDEAAEAPEPPEPVVHTLPSQEGESSAALSTAMKVGYMLGRDAETYAAEVRNGYSLVAVRAGFGYRALAITTLARSSPVAFGTSEPSAKSSIAWDEGAPLSSAIQAPVLLKDQPAAPLSDFLGISPLAKGRTFGPPLFPELASPHFSLSSLFRIPQLTNKAAPLSGLFGLKIKTDNPAPLSSLTGIPLRSGKAAPLSSLTGLPLLTKKAAPLSSLLGLPVLTKKQ